ncbi:MAG: hypothetical protein IPG69_15900 [Flavobacteriales bacterium]|nr:hypothetical protein [Flavobacteriales bacterium]
MNIPENVRIKKDTYLGDYAIRFAFTDGHVSDIDFHPFLSAAARTQLTVSTWM